MAKNTVNVSQLINRIAACVDEVNARRRNFGKLPKAKDVRIVPCTNTGKFTDHKYTTKSWNLEVDVLVNDKVVTHDWNVWVVAAGMKCTTARFTDLAKAKAMKKEILRKWGKSDAADAGEGERKPKAAKARKGGASDIVAALGELNIPSEDLAKLIEVVKNAA